MKKLSEKQRRAHVRRLRNRVPKEARRKVKRAMLTAQLLKVKISSNRIAKIQRRMMKEYKAQRLQA
jgi:hypothetical protein